MYQNTRIIPTTGYARVMLFMFRRRELGGTGTGCLFQFTYCDSSPGLSSQHPRSIGRVFTVRIHKVWKKIIIKKTQNMTLASFSMLFCKNMKMVEQSSTNYSTLRLKNDLSCPSFAITKSRNSFISFVFLVSIHIYICYICPRPN